MTYTWTAVAGVMFAALIDLGILRTNLLRRKAFWVSYAIIFCFQLLVNGILTGKQLVVYAPGKILGDATPHLLGHWRIADAPVEDLLFGFSLVLQTIAWWVWWGRRMRRARDAR